MTINIISGSCQLGRVVHGLPLTLIHGGAGPADPKGPQALSAHDAILAIAQALSESAEDTNPLLSATVIQQLGPFSAGETRCLHAATLLERHPRFNAGFGAALQADGQARVSASFMESRRQKFSAVMNVTDVMHPSRLAFFLQRERFCVLDTTGSANLARDLQIPRDNLVTPERFERWLTLKRESMNTLQVADGKGTIGCVTLASDGTLAALTSTGGVGNETVGRVGDTPTVAGNYCTAEVAISCTGYGEQILNSAFAARTATRVADGFSLEDAMRKGMQEALERGYEFAAIAVAIDSSTGMAHWVTATTEPYFIWAAILPEGIRTFRD